MVQSSWVEDLLPVSFSLFSCFLFCSSSPKSASVARMGLVVSPSASIPFIFFTSNFSFLGVDTLTSRQIQGLRPTHSSSHSCYHTPFSLLADIQTILFLNSPSHYQFTSSAADLLNGYLHTPPTYSLLAIL